MAENTTRRVGKIKKPKEPIRRVIINHDPNVRILNTVGTRPFGVKVER